MMRWSFLALAGLLAGCNRPTSDRADAQASPVASAAPSPKSEAARVLDQWFGAETAEARTFILYRADVNARAFRKAMPAKLLPSHPKVDDYCERTPVGGACQASVDGRGGDPHVMWLHRTPTSFEVDWKGSYVVNPMTMAVFRARMPTSRKVWRLDAKLSTYFNYEYMGKEATHYSFELTELGSPSVQSIHAYAKKGTADAEAMVEALAKGSQNVTVAIAYPDTKRNNGIVDLLAFYGTDFRQTEREIADDKLSPPE